MDATHLSELADPVMERAILADCGAPCLRDRAARFVLARLDYPCPLARSGALCYSMRARRSDWIDAEALEFFQRFPTGLCVEIDGGLSTRFHRLSDHMDWPRFSWRAVNTAEVDAWLRYVFPRMDNFQSMAARVPLAAWRKQAGLQSASRILLIVGEHRPLVSLRELRALCASLRQVMSRTVLQVDLLIRHGIQGFDAEVGQQLALAEVTARFNAYSPDDAFLFRLNPFRDRACQLSCGQLVHLRILHQESSER